MKRHKLTDRSIAALKPAPQGERRDIPDLLAPGLVCRVNSQGMKAWYLVARLPGHKRSSRLALGGTYPSMPLEEARAVARVWRSEFKAGRDPRLERQRDQANKFAALCDLYFADMGRRGLRRAGEVERCIKVELLPLWGPRLISTITRRDVVAAIDGALQRGVSGIARNLASYCARVFNFAIERGMLETSPCDRLKPSRLIGPKAPRSRILSDAELRALWHADIGYPWSEAIRLLMLTAQRRSDVAEIRWREVDIVHRIWTIPAERYKSRAPHVVPLSDDALSLLSELPRFERGDFVFSTSLGAKPIRGFSRVKRRIDAIIGSNGWVIHDIRRTARTHFSMLPVPDVVKELVIGHSQRGLHRVYDRYEYLDEKRHCLTLWANRLREIVS
jgi:integrase